MKSWAEEIHKQTIAVGTNQGQGRATTQTSLEIVPELVPSPTLLAILHCGLETVPGPQEA